MERIVLILTRELDVNLIDGFHRDAEPGKKYRGNEFFYNSGPVRFVEIWKPHQPFNERTKIDVFDLLETPELDQFILANMRRHLHVWLDQRTL